MQAQRASSSSSTSADSEHAAGAVEIRPVAGQEAIPRGVTNPRIQSSVEQPGARRRDCDAAPVPGQAPACRPRVGKLDIRAAATEALLTEVVRHSLGRDCRHARPQFPACRRLTAKHDAKRVGRVGTAPQLAGMLPDLEYPDACNVQAAPVRRLTSR